MGGTTHHQIPAMLPRQTEAPVIEEQIVAGPDLPPEVRPIATVQAPAPQVSVVQAPPVFAAPPTSVVVEAPPAVAYAAAPVTYAAAPTSTVVEAAPIATEPVTYAA